MHTGQLNSCVRRALGLVWLPYLRQGSKSLDASLTDTPWVEFFVTSNTAGFYSTKSLYGQRMP